MPGSTCHRAARIFAQMYPPYAPEYRLAMVDLVWSFRRFSLRGRREAAKHNAVVAGRTDRKSAYALAKA